MKHSEDIKVRLDPLLIAALQQLADQENEGNLSAVVRKGLKTYVQSRTAINPAPALRSEPRSAYVHG